MHKILLLKLLIFSLIIPLGVIAQERRVTYVHTDLLGSPVAETDEKGQIKGASPTIPQAPSNVTAQVQNGDDVLIKWNAVTDAAYYEREVSLNGGDWQLKSQYDAPQVSVVFNNQQNRRYAYRVRACVNARCSAWTLSNTVTVNNTPNAPASVSVRIKNGDDIQISWSSVTNADYYTRQVSLNGGAWKLTKTYDAPQTSVTFNNQRPRSYRYRIRACNTTCSSWKMSKTVTVDSKISTPSSVKAKIVGGNDIEISWSKVSGADFYNREVSINGGAWISRKKYDAPQLNVLFKNQQSRSYRYRVRACNTSCSSWKTSNTVTIP